MSEKPTVSDIFRRSLEIRREKPDASFDDVRAQLVKEYQGSEFPSPAFLTIPELDDVAPEEDWTAGLPIVLRGIHDQNWEEIAHGIIISLEQVENYPIESGREDDPEKNWRNREKGISEVTKDSVGKWMPEDLMDLARRSTKN